MKESDQINHKGLLFQIEVTFMSAAFECLVSREEAKTQTNTKTRYRVVFLNKDSVSAEAFLNMLFLALGTGEAIAFPVNLPSLDSVIVDREINSQEDNSLSKVQIGLSGTDHKSMLGTLSFWLRNKRVAFLVRIAPSISLSGIPLAKEIFQEKDGISKITLAWVQGGEGSDSQFGAAFTLTIGDWNQEYRFGCLTVDTKDGKKAEEQEEHAACALLEETKNREKGEVKQEETGRQKVEKKKGPFAIKQIGIELKPPQSKEDELKVFLKFTVLLSFSVIDVQMTGLKLGLPMKDLTKFQPSALKKLDFDMEGLSVDFQNHGLMVGGMLRKAGNSYAGAVRVKYQSFELSALGAYEKMADGSHSLFFWLLVKTPIGGPPAFFITGLAGGFGLNRRIRVPGIKEVKDFPLVAMIRDKSPERRQPGIGEVLELLEAYITPEQGNYFIALGIEFTTFELLRTFALGIVTFGTELELHLLGVTTLSMPAGAAKPLVYMELFLKAAILPSKGILSLEGQLSDQSYLFDQNCKLTGGFAMCVWFGSNPHAGDFVVTIGGYHPRFLVPAHYPSVERVGIRWVILPQLTLEGSAYFALTPAGIMAGGGLSLLYQSGGLRAWFIADADFLMQWAPLHYDISIRVSVGVSYTFRIFRFRKTLGIELGAALHLYGPEFAGEVHISWFIISFTIKFGNRNSVMPKISWMEFKSRFLCDAQKYRVVSGMVVRDESGKGEEKTGKLPELDGKKPEFELQSKIPMTEVFLGGQALYKAEKANPRFGVLPMGENNRLTNTANIYFMVWEEKGYKACGQMPAGILKKESLAPALWGMNTPPMNGSGLISGAVTTVRFKFTPSPLKDRDIKYYREEDLTANQQIRANSFSCSDCFIRQRENPGMRMDKKLVRWVQESHKKSEAAVLHDLEKKKNQIVDELGRSFSLWNVEELKDHQLYEGPCGVFLTAPTVREPF